MEIYRGAEVPDYVDIRGNNVCFTEGDVAVATFYHTDAIGAAKAILKHFKEECDAAAEMRSAHSKKDAHIREIEARVEEKDEEIRVLNNLICTWTETTLGLQKEVSMLSADLDEARDTIARMRRADSEKPKLRQEIARLRSALADAERHRDEAAQRAQEAEERRKGEKARRVEAEVMSFDKDEEISRLLATMRSFGASDGADDIEAALAAKDRLLDHYRAVVADLSTREE